MSLYGGYYMKAFKLILPTGVADLLLAAQSTSSWSGERYYLSGDLNQMSIARQEAQKLGLRCEIEGGIPFLTCKKDLDTLIAHLYKNKFPGYYNYPAPVEAE